MQMNFVPNPFTNRGVITTPADFFGRKQQISEILTRLRTMQSSSVVGERRIGKSSLLYHLAQTGAQRLEDSNYRFHYIDFQDAHYHTAVGFFQTALSKLGLATDSIKEEKTLNRNLIAFTDKLEELEQSGQHLVLCLDEFENTFQHPAEFTDDFFDHFRSQISFRKFAFVTATGRALQDLCLEGKFVSPFYNVFTVSELQELTEEETQQFVAAYDERVNFTDDELQFIFSYLPTHPLKLQILCDWVLRNRQQQFREDVLVEGIIKECENFFVDMFDLKNARRGKKLFSLDKIKKLFETIKSGRDTFSGKE
jgi:uncharacterized protein